MRRSPFRPRVISALLLVCYLPSCTKWGPPPQAGATPLEAIQAKPGQRVRVTLRDSNRVVLKQTRIEGDSLLGMTRSDLDAATTATVRPKWDQDKYAASIPLSDVVSVQVRRSAPLKTVGLVLGLVVLVGPLVMYMVAYACC